MKNKSVDTESQTFAKISIQTACSAIEIQTTKSEYINIKSKSQEQLIKLRRKQYKRQNYIIQSTDFQEEIREWLTSNSDKINVKLWTEKLKRLASKLSIPGEEERLRRKIEQYLEITKDIFSERSEDNSRFKEQMPNYIIRKLKRLYLRSQGRDLKVHRVETPKYYSRSKIDNLRKVLKCWLRNNEEDLCDRSKMNEIFKDLFENLEPLVLDRPKENSDYKTALKTNILDIVKDTPIIMANEYNLNNLIDNLIDDILNIENKIPTTYIQPTVSEIKRFVKEEINFILEKSRIAISPRGVKNLEIELTNNLLDLTDVEDVDYIIINDITKIIKDIVNLSENKAKYFTSIIVNDYKEFFFRKHYFTHNVKRNLARPEVSSGFEVKVNSSVGSKENKTDMHLDQFTEEIHKLLKYVPIKNIKIKERMAEELTHDIIERRKDLQVNPNQEIDLEEIKYLKYQIYKKTKKYVENQSSKLIENVRNLSEWLKHAPCDLKNNQSDSQLNENNDNIEPSIEVLSSAIHKWFHQLPIDDYSLEDTNLNRNSMKNLAKDITAHASNREFDKIDKQVDEWIVKMFNKKLSYTHIQQLKDVIEGVPYVKNIQQDIAKQQKNILRSYEDAIDEWTDSIILKENKDNTFVTNRNEYVHNLAVRLFKTSITLTHLPSEEIRKKLQGEIINWIKTLHFQQPIDKQNDWDKYAMSLARKLLACHDGVSSKIITTQIETDTVSDKLQRAIINWLKKLPQNKTSNEPKQKEKQTQESELTTENRGSIDDEINDDSNKLQTVKYVDIENAILPSPQDVKELPPINEDQSLEANIEVWLNKLPILIKNPEYLESLKMMLVEKIKPLINDPSKIKNEIIIFMKRLPMNISKKLNDKYLHEEASNLIDSFVKNREYGRPNNLLILLQVGEAIKDWANHLPIKSVYDPRELRFMIDELTLVIDSLIINPSQRDKYEHIKEKIADFLKRFPLKPDRFSEQYLTERAEYLTKKLKDVQTNLKKNIKPSPVSRTNISVYGLSVNSTTDEFSIKSINTEDINANLDTYTRQIVQQVTEWLNGLSLPLKLHEGEKQVMINDLAGDIVDRYKYLELNPDKRKSPEDEIEHMKFQIFKWVNRLVGNSSSITIEKAENLMKRVQNVPAPMLTRPQSIQSYKSKESPLNTSTQSQVHREQATSSGVKGITSATYNTTNNFTEEQNKNPKEVIFEKYTRIFKEKVNELPIDSPTPESLKLAELARTGIYNGIVKTFFRLKSNPELENDYGYFELILEDKLDEMLDLLPQTEKLKGFRHGWKLSILSNVMEMLKKLQEVSDRESFKQRLKEGFSRKIARMFESEQCYLLQQGFLAEMADVFILKTKYKEEDHIKANIYKQRLMMKVDELANHLTKHHNTEFRYIKKSELARLAMQVMEEVPVPKEDILQDEVEKILLAEEIEQWYKELPITPYMNNFDQVFRKRMIDLLAKKLHEIEKNAGNLDESKERQMKHEMSLFLAKRGNLEKDEDLNINVMVDDLANRIKNKRLKDVTVYGDFEKNKPTCSTFVKMDSTEVLSPLLGASTGTENIHKPFEMHGTLTSSRQKPVLGSNQTGPSQGYNLQFHPQTQNPTPYFTSSVPRPNITISDGVPYTSWPAGQNSRLSSTTTFGPNMNQTCPKQSYSTQSGIPMQAVIQPRPPSSFSHPTQVGLPMQLRPTKSSSSKTGLESIQNDPRQNVLPIAASTQTMSPFKPLIIEPQEQRQYRPKDSSILADRNQYGHEATFLQNGPKNYLDNNKVIQPRQQPVFTPKEFKGTQGMPKVDRSVQSRKDTINLKLGERYPQYQEFGEERPRDFTQGNKAVGTSTDDEDERLGLKCRCMKRRRVCVDSYPCPVFLPPCRCFF